MKSQTNQVFELIQELGLNPSDFVWEKHESSWDTFLKIPILIHKPSGYYMTFDLKGDLRFSVFSPGRDEWTQSIETRSWFGQTKAIRKWLQYLKRETESPDLWNAISQEKNLIEASASSDTSNALFSNNEREYISAALAEIKEYILSTQSFTPEQTKYIEDRLHYLKEASERMGRKDWITLTVGVLTNIIVGVALAPDAARELFHVAGQVLQQILSGPHLLL
jgi:hypothetical protein